MVRIVLDIEDYGDLKNRRDWLEGRVQEVHEAIEELPFLEAELGEIRDAIERWISREKASAPQASSQPAIEASNV